ncbi:D-alanyl-D-alanine carboxypeptidase family protein (macronuclear) [Tetrahymena thermophila SB210]|uniref:D-alanyl-D-alanine carboxypeptidase family protein n=1 Tax=Tetrahymena thermophila (strain SB210) TaxID=312017 RepID=I7LVB0_TETTS|nr:D-alanyl-D-alanine carboxypeptidase family protein [Tetrahymena thermophila SB210]EAR97583.1 D-alanyl-D-alanine carboxypeptidase family protein [Tetrahymena thermophila SB210]|eukprot:XP_001017828.1 D-alanyl-D-alanine carboxypeptidase family protein [Tetrahymena thermophila SB210]
MQRNISTPVISKKQSIHVPDYMICNQIEQIQTANVGSFSSNLSQNNIQGNQLYIASASNSYLSQLLCNNTPLTSALSAAVYCQNRLIYNKNGSEALEIASLTKVMTFFTSLKLSAKHELDPQSVYVRVPKAAAFICGTSACLRNGEYIKLCDLFYALMLPSGNDAACTLANFFGQLERRRANSSSAFLDQQAAQILIKLYGLIEINQQESSQKHESRESEISTDAQEQDSKDSGEDERRSSTYSQGVKIKESNQIQQIQFDQLSQQADLMHINLEQQKQQILNNTQSENPSNQNKNSNEDYKFHQQQGDVQENMKFFVKIMNQEAQKLQMRNTQYSNPHGLSDKGNKSSAIDYGRLCYAAMSSFALFRQVVKTPLYSCKILLNKDLIQNKKNSLQTPTNQNKTLSVQTMRNAQWENTNKLLLRNSHFIGIKTGNTPNAGPCLATHYQKNGIDIQVIVLKCKDSEKRWVDSQKLAEWAYQQILQDCTQTLQTENNCANQRLMSAQRNRKIKIQQQYQDEFTKLLQQNKEEDPSSKSQLISDFNLRYRPKTTLQTEHSLNKSQFNIRGITQNKIPPPQPFHQKCNSQNQLNQDQQRNKSICKSGPVSSQFAIQNNRKNVSSIALINDDNNNNNINKLKLDINNSQNAINNSQNAINNSQNAINNSQNVINNSQYNIRANIGQLYQRETDRYDVQSNSSSIQIISCDDLEQKNDQEDIYIEEDNNLSFEKNDNYKANDIQMLSDSFQENMEDLLHLKTQSQKVIVGVSKLSSVDILNGIEKKFSSQNNLDQEIQTTISSYRQIQIKTKNQQINQKKPQTAIFKISKETAKESDSSNLNKSNIQNKLISPRRRIINAKFQVSSVDLTENTKSSNNQAQKIGQNRVNISTSSQKRSNSGKQFCLNLIQANKNLQIDTQQNSIIKNQQTKQYNSTKNVQFAKQLPPITNKSIIISNTKFTEDTVSPPKQIQKSLNQSVIKTIFQ